LTRKIKTFKSITTHLLPKRKGKRNKKPSRSSSPPLHSRCPRSGGRVCKTCMHGSSG
jgi:DNA polymerase II large subunit